MKTLIIFIICFFTSVLALSQNLVQCDVKLNSENHFAFLAEGKAITDLDSGELFVLTKSDTKDLINDEIISTRKASTATCTLDRAIKPESYKFYYIECQLPKDRLITVSNSYNWMTNRGVYQEALNVNGNYAITYFFLENCKKLSDRK